MKKLILAMIVITMALLVSISNEQHTIIVYSSMEQFRGEELQKQLNEKFPDLHVMVMYVSTAKAAAKYLWSRNKAMRISSLVWKPPTWRKLRISWRISGERAVCSI